MYGLKIHLVMNVLYTHLSKTWTHRYSHLTYRSDAHHKIWASSLHPLIIVVHVTIRPNARRLSFFFPFFLLTDLRVLISRIRFFFSVFGQNPATHLCL